MSTPKDWLARNRWLASPVVAVFAFFAVWLVVEWRGCGKPEAWSAGISFLTFAGLLYTIRQQGNELRLQRREIKMTRQVLRAQKEELKNQVHQAKRMATIHLLTALLQDFRQQPMAEALTRLREFSRANPELSLGLKSDKEIENVLGQFMQRDPDFPSQVLAVGHFFTSLVAAWQRGLLTDDLVFGFWRLDDMELIPRVLHPLHPIMYARYGGAPPNRTLDDWSKLYAGALNWHGVIPAPGASGL